MSAEIFILSGARAGEQILVAATEFRVGGERNCEVFFDPQRDLCARGQSARFRLFDDGWYVTSEGTGELLLNQQVVSGRTRIRSGDVLRMTSEGPDFCFNIVSRTAAAVGIAPLRLPAANVARVGLPVSPASAPAASTPSPAVVPSVSHASVPAVPPAAALVQDSTRDRRWRWDFPRRWGIVIGAVGCLAVAVLFFGIGRYFWTNAPVASSDQTEEMSRTDRIEAARQKFHADRDRKNKQDEEKQREEEKLRKALDGKEHRRLEQEAWKKREQPPEIQP